MKLIKHLEGSIDLCCVHISLGHIFGNAYRMVNLTSIYIFIGSNIYKSNIRSTSLLSYCCLIKDDYGVGDEVKKSFIQNFPIFLHIGKCFPIERNFLYLHTHLHVTFTHDLPLMWAFLHIIIVTMILLVL